eukprot:scaffold3428_cov136-Skeletonema_marinoi.AAC.5
MTLIAPTRSLSTHYHPNSMRVIKSGHLSILQQRSVNAMTMTMTMMMTTAPSISTPRKITSRKSGNTATSLVHLRTASLVAPHASRYPASPKATQHSAALPSASLPTSSLPPARSHFEIRRHVKNSKKRIEGQKSGRTPDAAAFDSNKEERMIISASIISAHEGEDEAEGAWNSMTTGQLRAERQHAHKRTPQFDQTSDNTYACVAGWIQRYNKKCGSNFSMYGISDEEIIAGGEKGVRCNICDYVLPSSVGLKNNFISEVNREKVERGDANRGHPLRYHHERCGAKCDRCGITVDDYVLAKGNDTGWNQHANSCRRWHEQFNDLIKVQKKHGKWRIDPTNKAITSEEKSALRWKDKQRAEPAKGRLTEYQKEKLASTFKGWGAINHCGGGLAEIDAMLGT